MMLYVERRANRGSSVMRRWLHVHVPKIRPLEDHTVSNTVQRNSTCKANRRRARLLLDGIQQREVILLQHQLYGGREVLVSLLDFGAWHAWLAEIVRHFARKDSA